MKLYPAWINKQGQRAQATATGCEKKLVVAYFLALQHRIYSELVMVIGNPELHPICRNVVYLGKKLIHVVVVCYGRTMGRVKKKL